ncbi:uncharacterized protein CYBJADRAFT_164639 [Cyberlindnera jadinii NRRL Y-1542]|uniref:Uncharacterized protein n=1 Tax=Cyberlindnera jadinii (strain ATCC 18201 / CBS 1600 / BCRC 20928 / JCM 3617 / NBRC 0987 / NRRL Y-1542) TaxID=983966 RepID=A0A1E4RUZ9_CYBJN|nr:hypothetical protein CYBJADRAFT_164639 [Cyberlindnera jadinii NRRL Y-1542]ODV71107.1 hypothetical protein CYBJADRAFT_164639 [Cyberlindnera jadinii NRRL Y-1542]
MEQLPSLSQTLLVNVLSDLPEETKELQRSLVESATKYRTDLDKQVQSTLRLQQNVGHSHELLQKRLRRCVRSIDEANHHLKVGLADGSLANEVSELSELVMGKLMGIVSLLGARNVDGDRWPLLKSVLGQDGFEVIDEELGDMKLGNETECTRDDGHDDSNGSNGSDRETIQPLSSNTLDEHLEVSSTVSDAVG